jgi:hypothetical protein
MVHGGMTGLLLPPLLLVLVLLAPAEILCRFW